MAQGSNTLHEAPAQLSPEIIDRHRAIQSLMEELAAVDWYDQRVAACTDDELRAILAHNRDEEKEHASMVLEWIRRHDPAFDAHLREYLFKDGPIKEEKGAQAGSENGKRSDSLNLGSLRTPGTK